MVYDAGCEVKKGLSLSELSGKARNATRDLLEMMKDNFSLKPTDTGKEVKGISSDNPLDIVRSNLEEIVTTCDDIRKFFTVQIREKL